MAQICTLFLHEWSLDVNLGKARVLTLDGRHHLLVIIGEISSEFLTPLELAWNLRTAIIIVVRTGEFATLDEDYFLGVRAHTYCQSFLSA